MGTATPAESNQSGKSTFLKVAILTLALSQVVKAEETVTVIDCEQMADTAYNLAMEGEGMSRVRYSDGKVGYDFKELEAFYYQAVKRYGDRKFFKEIFIYTFRPPLLDPVENGKKIKEMCLQAIGGVAI